MGNKQVSTTPILRSGSHSQPVAPVSSTPPKPLLSTPVIATSTSTAHGDGDKVAKSSVGLNRIGNKGVNENHIKIGLLGISESGKSTIFHHMEK
jgi:hypothetical protein